VLSVNDEAFKELVLVVVAILVISLVINAFLSANPQSFSEPPLRIQGYITEHGDPVPGYYLAPNQNPALCGFAGNRQASK
jgi:hypothetical protein